MLNLKEEKESSSSSTTESQRTASLYILNTIIIHFSVEVTEAVTIQRCIQKI